MGLILLILVVLFLVGALPTWPHSKNWGYYPSGGLGLVVLILLVLVLTGPVMKDALENDDARTVCRSRTEGFMKQPAWGCATLIACMLAVAGCSTLQKVLPTAAWHEARVRNEGYSLLYQLLSQESDVAKVLIIKHADPPVNDVIQEIASTSAQAKKTLEQFHEKDRRLSFEMANLPPIEQQTRAAIQSTVTKQLLFSSGKTFDARLLFTQGEALNYAAHLATVLHEKEKNQDRKDFLVTLSQRCTTLHDRVISLLKY